MAHPTYSVPLFSQHMEVDSSDLINLFQTFIEEFAEEMIDLKASLLNKDYIQMQRIAHNIKGIAANLEMDSLFEFTKSLNDGLKNNEPLPFDELVTKIEKEYTSIVDYLKEYYGSALNLEG